MRDSISADAIYTKSREILQEHGLTPSEIIADGTLHRCAVEGKSNARDGAYIVHADDLPVVWWQNFVTGDKGSDRLFSKEKLSKDEKHILKERIEAARVESEKLREQRKIDGVHRAQALWKTYDNADAGNAYLVKKGIEACGDVRETRGSRLLVVPVLSDTGDGSIMSLQYISPTGKRFLSGTQTRGGYFSLVNSENSSVVCIAEGYATACSIHMATGLNTIAVFSAGNLLPVAKLLASTKPRPQIVICADYDTPNEVVKTEGGVGVAKAREAAKEVGGILAIPQTTGAKADFNDIHQSKGLEEVKRQIEAAMANSECHEVDTSNIPAGFSIGDGHLYKEITSKEGEVELFTIGDELTACAMSRAKGGESWGLCLQWRDPDGGHHEWIMPKGLLSGDGSAIVETLLSGGWRFEGNPKAKKYLIEFLNQVSPAIRKTAVTHTGWNENTFVFPDTVFSVGNVGNVGNAASDAGLREVACRNACRKFPTFGSEEIVLMSRNVRNPYQVCGTLDEWRSTIGTWAQGNHLLMLSLCLAFSGPLLELAGAECGGINLFGQSSSGKSTALKMAASVWGLGSFGDASSFPQTWRSTANGLEGAAVLHSDTLLCLDELGQASGKTVEEAAYLLGNGQGKQRSDRTGKARAVATWRCSFLSTGEMTFEQKIKGAGGRVYAGQGVRIADIAADAGAGHGIFEDLHGFGNGQAFSEAIAKAARTSYGMASRAFVQRLVGQRAEAKTFAEMVIERGLPEFCPDGADGQVARVAKRFLLYAAAGELATKWNVLPWKKREACEACWRAFSLWLEQRGGAGAMEDSMAFEQVMLFLEKHGQSRFQDLKIPDEIVRDRCGFKESKDGGTYFYVLPQSFKSEVCKGLDFRRVAKLLEAKGLLKRGDGRNVQRKVALPHLGFQRCYCLFIKSDGEES